jgi:hypothetical protein
MKMLRCGRRLMRGSNLKPCHRLDSPGVQRWGSGSGLGLGLVTGSGLVLESGVSGLWLVLGLGFSKLWSSLDSPGAQRWAILQNIRSYNSLEKSFRKLYYTFWKSNLLSLPLPSSYLPLVRLKKLRPSFMVLLNSITKGSHGVKDPLGCGRMGGTITASFLRNVLRNILVIQKEYSAWNLCQVRVRVGVRVRVILAVAVVIGLGLE